MTEHKSCVFTFADIEVREREFCIVKNGEVLAIEPKAFRVLLCLIRNPRQLVSKDELLNVVWKDFSVSENSLTQCVARLRRALGDDIHEPRYIATVPTLGYRFLPEVQVAEDGHLSLDIPVQNGHVTESGATETEAADRGTAASTSGAANAKMGSRTCDNWRRNHRRNNRCRPSRTLPKLSPAKSVFGQRPLAGRTTI
jgi:DNA-binding winged helix-turn-helix (wHTH) protein